MNSTLSILGLLALSLPGFAQVGELGDLPAPVGLEPAEPLVAVDGRPVQPGRIPDTTDDKARTLWQTILNTTGIAAGRRLERFDLRFDIQVNRSGSHNDLGRARFQFWAGEQRDWLRSEWEKNGRTQMVGPHEKDARRRDYWLIEGSTKTRLEGRENRQSRQEMDEWASIARNFLTLASPGESRLVELVAQDTLDAQLPRELYRTRAASLDWLLVRSPDFQLVTTGAPASQGVYRARLGVDRTNGQVVMAVLSEDADLRAAGPSAVFVEVAEWCVLGDHRLPRSLNVFRAVTDEAGVTRFPELPTAELWLLDRRSRLNPEFQPKDFMPERSWRSAPVERALEIGERELHARGASVRAGLVRLELASALEQRANLVFGERVPCHDRRPAGRAVQHLLKDVFGLGRASGPSQHFDHVPNEAFDVRVAQPRRKAVHGDGRLAEHRGIDADTLQSIQVTRQELYVGARQLDELGNETLLDLWRSGAHVATHQLERQAFVECVLVDDLEAAGHSPNDVGPVHLKERSSQVVRFTPCVGLSQRTGTGRRPLFGRVEP